MRVGGEWLARSQLPPQQSMLLYLAPIVRLSAPHRSSQLVDSPYFAGPFQEQQKQRTKKQAFSLPTPAAKQPNATSPFSFYCVMSNATFPVSFYCKTVQRHFSVLFLLCAALTLSPVSVFSPRCTPRRSRRSPRVSSALPPTWPSGPLGSQPRTGKSACRSAPRKPGSWRSK